MTDSFKPRIDFDGPLDEAKAEQFKGAQAFDGEAAEKFAPVALDDIGEPDRGSGAAPETQSVA